MKKTKAKKAPSIFVATPMYGGMCTGDYTISVHMLLRDIEKRGWDWEYRYIFNESLITRARNDLTAMFLNSDATHLLFIDADIKFRADDVIRMIEADKDVICGAYPKKKVNWLNVQQAALRGAQLNELPISAGEYVFNVKDNQNTVIQLGSDDIVEVVHAGTGFMLIKREVFDKIKDVPTYINNSMFPGQITKNFFDTSIDPKSNTYLSEDYHFCNLWTGAGGSIYMAAWVRLGHIGTFTFGAA